MSEPFLENKTAIVTGGSRGIGRAIVEALLEAGAAAAICGRNAEYLEKAVTELAHKSKRKIVGRVADVSKPDEVSGLFEFADSELGGLDILVNNAGSGKFASVGNLTIQDWREMLDTNLSGVFYCCREALPRFRRRGAGYVINIGSLAGSHAFAGGAAYNASKFGLNGFSEAMMLDYRYDNVRVSCIMPGSVDTSFGSAAHADWKIAPRDIADIVLMLLRTPARTLVSRVEVRPSKPGK